MTLAEGTVQKVELLTTTGEKVSGRIVKIGGTVYRLGKKDSKGTRKLRPLKSQVLVTFNRDVEVANGCSEL